METATSTPVLLPTSTATKASRQSDGAGVPLMVPDLPRLDALIPYLKQIDENRWYSNFGPLCRQLEDRLTTIFSAGNDATMHVVTVGSCTSGIELALRALNLPGGSLVLVPAITFVATATAVLSAGLTPVIADIDPASWLLTPDLALPAVKARAIKAVVPVATFGASQNAAAWAKFHESTGIPVIIDAAAGFGNQNDPGPTCAVFSMHATKPFASGEGGFVVTRSAELAGAIRQLSNFGINLTDPAVSLIGTTTLIGTNAKLSEYHSAVGLASLDQWKARASQRRAVYKSYVAEIRSIASLVTQWQEADANTVRSLCCFLLPTREMRDRFERELAAANIATRRWYLPTVNRHPAFKKLDHFPTPVADKVSRRLLGVPFFPAITRASRNKVLRALEQSAARG